MQQGYERQLVVVPSAGEQQLILYPGCGDIMGHTVAPRRFVEICDVASDRRVRRTGSMSDAALLRLTDPISMKTVDTGHTRYADDFIRGIVCKDLQEFVERNNKLDASLAHCLEPLNLQQF